MGRKIENAFKIIWESKFRYTLRYNNTTYQTPVTTWETNSDVSELIRIHRVNRMFYKYHLI